VLCFTSLKVSLGSSYTLTGPRLTAC